MQPLRPFAGMTRIRFKGFGVSPSQPRSGTPLEYVKYLAPTTPDVKFQHRTETAAGQPATPPTIASVANVATASLSGA